MTLRIPVATIVLGLLLANYAVAAPPQVPSLNDPATTEWLPGKFVWVDLVTPDPVVARKFYGGLFGWSFADYDDYSIAYVGDDAVAGIARRPATMDVGLMSRWVAFLSVADVTAATQLAADKGGHVLISARNVPDRGEMALLADPDDAIFGVIRSTSGDPPDSLSPTGDFIWAVYQSPAASRAAAFYQDLGEYEVVAADNIPTVPDFLLVSNGYARAVVVEIPADRSNLRPDWLYFVRVDNVAASVARARELGARVLMAPRPDMLVGGLAVIVDPVGAPLGLLEWPDPDAKGNSP